MGFNHHQLKIPFSVPVAQLQKLHLAARRDGRGTSFLPGGRGAEEEEAMGFQMVSWDFMGSNGILWYFNGILMGLHGISMDVKWLF